LGIPKTGKHGWQALGRMKLPAWSPQAVRESHMSHGDGLWMLRKHPNDPLVIEE